MFYDEEIEKTVLAYLLKNVRHINTSRNFMRPDFFYFQNLRRMYSALVRVFDSWHTTMSYEIFAGLLKKAKVPVETETAFQILFHEITAIEVDDDKFSYHIDRLKDLKIKRDLAGTASLLTPEVIQGGDGEAILNALNERVHKMRIDSNLLVVKKNFIFEKDFIEERIKEYEYRKEFGDMAGIPFGWSKLDDFTSGHYPGEVTLVFSRTGGGKTRVLTTFAYNGATAGRKGMFITIEMSNIEIARLYDSRMGRVHFEALKKGKLTVEDEEKWRGLLDLMGEKDDNGLYVVDMPRGCTVSAIEEEINSYEKLYGKLDFVVVDYLMLMDSVERTTDTKEKLGEIVRGLKQMARIKQVSVLTAIQANRKVTDIKGEEVGTEHISLSDQVAAHCNNILYLYRSGDDILTNTLQVNLVKYRDGGNITFSVHTDWKIAYIGDEILSMPVSMAPLPPLDDRPRAPRFSGNTSPL